MLFQFGSKNVLETNISNGTSEISPKIKRLARYFLRFRVLKKPSIRKNMKIGKAILPIMENAFDMYSNAPLLFSMGVISALFVWSMSIEINAMYFSLAPLRIWYGFSVCVFVVWDTACCGSIAFFLVIVFGVTPVVLVVLGDGVMFGGIVAPFVIKSVYLFVGV